MYNFRIPCPATDYSPELLEELAYRETQDGAKLMHNQNFIVIDESTYNYSGETEFYSDEKVLGIARYDASNKSFDFINHETTVMGVKLNPEQSIAYHYAVNVPEMLCIAVTGKAGTGKTFALALAGLHKLKMSRKHYAGVAYSKEIETMGKDPGALPGEIEDKTKEHYMPLFQNIREITNNENKFDSHEYENMIEFIHVAYARGRNVMRKAVWIIDEFQNFKPKLAKSMCGRAGEDTLVGICGSSLQVDTRGLDEKNNGLEYTIERFTGQPWFTHIEFKRSERKGLSMYSDDLL
ncbi:PhoH [Bacillus phage SP-15]|uniref:PhoH n=1 Tax=Bacillus phage SP-15 TaxID=1792032 RepID=A0A127AWK4_9CAUD|nr:PhoH [Bacillus phage SP-15]AMM45096.1 PhoH [Bacillus phage SP-15]